MKELSQKEIQSIFSFTRKKYVRYKDVQVELVDHLACAIEERMGNDANVSFTKALYDIYGEFGIFGFAKIIEKKEKALKSFWRNKIWGYFTEYFQLPKILGTFSAMAMVLYIVSSGLIFMPLIYVSMAMFSVGILVYICYQNYMVEDQMQEYLYSKSYYTTALPLIYGVLLIPLHYGGEILKALLSPDVSYSFILIFSALYPMFIILAYLLLVKIPRKLKQDLLVNYAKYFGERNLVIR